MERSDFLKLVLFALGLTTISETFFWELSLNFLILFYTSNPGISYFFTYIILNYC